LVQECNRIISAFSGKVWIVLLGKGKRSLRFIFLLLYSVLIYFLALLIWLSPTRIPQDRFMEYGKGMAEKG